MVFIDQFGQYSDVPFLTRELKALLPDGSFASRVWRAIGSELHYRLVDWPDDSETEYSSVFPVDALFVWATEDGGLDPGWLASEDGSYLDDDGEEIPPTVKPSISAVEQLAAYGLWMLGEELDSRGPAPQDDDDLGPCHGRNDQGWKREEVIEHRAQYLLLAYEALAFSQRILIGTQLSAEEKAKAMKFNFSEMGKIGAQKRHAPMAALKSWAIEKYQAGEWKSANQAAHDLKDSVLEYGRTINAHLSERNAQRTIADWFRRSNKKSA